ncbi:MAG TPA: DUF1015 family protein [Methanomicrobia archaeon]|nr:DUF1015 family protein [Methanomicrobia archaeon]
MERTMVEIIPFTATILNPELENRTELVCPVYDTIDAQQYERYAARENNVIHFTTRRDGLAEDEFIASATRSLARFFREGLLTVRARPSFYLYGVRYTVPEGIAAQLPAGKRTEVYVCFGLVALVKVGQRNEPAIVGHERTFEAKTQERVHLMRACGMNFSPIVAEYSMPGHELNRLFETYLGVLRPDLKLREQRKPLVDVEVNGAHHLLWEIADDSLIERIQELMRDKELMILDGHHRYTAACQLSQDLAEGTAYTLMTLVEGGDRALLLLPWHRCVRACHMAELRQRIEAYFAVEPLDRDAGEAALYKQLHESGGGLDVRFLMYDGDRFYLLRADEQRVRQLANERGERVGLDVISLHEWLIGPTLIGKPEDLVFTASPREAVDNVNKGGFQVAFILKPLQIAEVEYKAHSERKPFPQKSTLFLPKVAEGVVMWRWK